MAQNSINYEKLDEDIRYIQTLLGNLKDSMAIGVAKTTELHEASGASYLVELNNANKDLLKSDDICVESTMTLHRLAQRYEEEHRRLAEKF